MKYEPLVTVLMPVFNGEKYLRDSIESILQQTYKNIEFLIIDDGSSDDSVRIVQSYDDPRIRLIRNEKNLKLIATLNRGIELANGKYIARMDCDDISLPRRIEEQVKFLEKNHDYVLCGTGCTILGKRFSKNSPINGWAKIRNRLVVGNCFTHPTVMFRGSILREKNIKYDEKYVHAEDFELWQRLSEEYKLENISKPLLKYRITPGSISRKYNYEQLNMNSKIANRGLEKNGIFFEKSQYMRPSLTCEEVINAKKELEDIVMKNKYYQEDKQQILVQLWLDICNRYTYQGIKAYKIFNSINELNMKKVNLTVKLKLLIKCLLRRKLT